MAPRIRETYNEVGVNHVAVTYQKAGAFEAQTVPTESPRPDHVQIEVAFTGICGTDLKIAHGDMDARFDAPWPHVRGFAGQA